MLEDAKYNAIKSAVREALVAQGFAVQETSIHPGIAYPGFTHLRVRSHDTCDTFLVTPVSGGALAQVLAHNVGVNYISLGFSRMRETKQIEVFIRLPDLQTGSDERRPYVTVFTDVWMRANATSLIPVPSILFNGGTKTDKIVTGVLDMVCANVGLVAEHWQKVGTELHEYGLVADQLEFLKSRKIALSHATVNAATGIKESESVKPNSPTGADYVTVQTNGRTQYVQFRFPHLSNEKLAALLDFASNL